MVATHLVEVYHFSKYWYNYFIILLHMGSLVFFRIILNYLFIENMFFIFFIIFFIIALDYWFIARNLQQLIDWLDFKNIEIQDLDAQLESESAIVQNLDVQLKSKDIKIQDLQNQLIETQQLKNSNSELIKSKDIKIQDLQNQLIETQQLKNSNSELIKSKDIKIQDLNTQLESLDAQLKSKDSINKKLFDSSNELIKSKNTEIQDLDAKLKSKDTKIKNLTTKVEKLKTNEEKFKETDKKLKETNKKNEKLQKDIEKLRNDSANKDVAIYNLKNKYNLLQQERETLEEEQLLDNKIEKRFYDMLREAKREIFISCPWLRKWVTCQILNILESAVNRGVTIYIVYGADKGNFESEKEIQQYKNVLRSDFFKFESVHKGTHVKACICDDYYLVGSYNFLSRTYNTDNKYNEKNKNYDWHELCYYGKNVKKLQKLKQEYFGEYFKESE